MEGHPGPADRTGIGLGMKSTVEWIIVFGLAVRAHAEMAHGGLGAVIGNVIDDGISRTTVGAVNKGISISTIVRIEKLIFTVIADGYIRRNQGKPLRILPAPADGKIFVAL